MAKNIAQFIRETKQETLKVTWPSRKETTTTTIGVLIMIAVMSVILLAADGAVAAAVEFILGLGVR